MRKNISAQIFLILTLIHSTSWPTPTKLALMNETPHQASVWLDGRRIGLAPNQTVLVTPTFFQRLKGESINIERADFYCNNNYREPFVMQQISVPRNKIRTIQIKSNVPEDKGLCDDDNVQGKIASVAIGAKDTTLAVIGKAIELPFGTVPRAAKKAYNYLTNTPARHFRIRGNYSLDIPIAGEKERQATTKRERRTRGKQEEFLGIDYSEDEPTLSVGLVGSGGGVRARLSTMGFVVGAEKIGLLDCSTYFSALSGSTWMLAPWLYSSQKPSDFREIVLRESNRYLLLNARNILNSRVLINDCKNIISGVPNSFTNIYSALLTPYLLNNVKTGRSAHNCFLSDIGREIDNENEEEEGNNIIPIFEARAKNPITKIKEICCFTPWEFGSRFFGKGAYIPIEAFNCSFWEGKSTKHASEPTLGYLMGIWGSAFTAPNKGIAEMILEKLAHKMFDFSEDLEKRILDTGIQPDEFGNQSATSARSNNFMRGMKYNCHDYSNQKTLHLFDSGVERNLPILSLYRRTKKTEDNITEDAPPKVIVTEGAPPEVIVIFDASADEIGAQLRKAADEILAQDLPFPQIPSQEEIENTIEKYGICTFDRNPDSTKYDDCDIPVVIYMSSLVNNAEERKGFNCDTDLRNFEFDIANFKTIKFRYRRNNADHFMKMTEYNISTDLSVNEIKKAMIIGRMRSLVRKMGEEEATRLEKYHELAGEKARLALSIREIKLRLQRNSTEFELNASNNTSNAPSLEAIDRQIEALEAIKTESNYEDINKQDNSGNTALILAAKNGYVEEVEALLDCQDTNINTKNNNGDTALIYAIKFRRIEIANLLLNHQRTNVNETDDQGQTALIHSVLVRDAEQLNALLAHQAIDVNTRDNHGNGALDYAIWFRLEGAIEALLAHQDIHVNEPNGLGNTPLLSLLKNLKFSIDERLINALLRHQGIDVNQKDANGKTPLITAVEEIGFLKGLNERLENETPTEIEGLPISYHSEFNSMKISVLEDTINTLLRHQRIDINETDNAGRTALDYAIDSGDTEIIDALRNHNNLGSEKQEPENNSSSSKNSQESNETGSTNRTKLDDIIDRMINRKYAETTALQNHNLDQKAENISLSNKNPSTTAVNTKNNARLTPLMNAV